MWLLAKEALIQNPTVLNVCYREKLRIYFDVDASWTPVVSSFERRTGVPVILWPRQLFDKFNPSFEMTYRSHKCWKVTDPLVRKMLREAICRKVIPLYQMHMEHHSEKKMSIRCLAFMCRWNILSKEKDREDIEKAIKVLSSNKDNQDANQTCLAAPKAWSPPSFPWEPRTRESAASSFPLLSASSTFSSTALSRAADCADEVSAARAGGTRSLTTVACCAWWPKPKQQEGAPTSLVLIVVREPESGHDAKILSET
ncbi:hypothetical protein EJB05_30382, partial [Eragrostis curvula]